MAFRARLIPPPDNEPKPWPWHQVKRMTVSASQVATGDRRIDAEAYLSSGFGIRRAIEKCKDSWAPFGSLASIWAPPRIKQSFVAPEFGIPYFNTSQVFDARPFPRKWLSLGKTSKAESRFARQGTILVVASGSTGRTTLVSAAHEKAFISHDFLRIEPFAPEQRGWLYAFLLSRQGQAMLNGAQYASVIRHIEPHHVAAIPVPNMPPAVVADFARRVDKILALRNQAFELAEHADAIFAQAVGPVEAEQDKIGFVVRASEVTASRRIEASYYAPEVTAVLRRFSRWERLGDVAKRVWWMTRFKRFFGDGGKPYLSADELFAVNPQGKRKILVAPDDTHENYFVKRGWLVMACSGQIYGMNGATAMMTEHHENVFMSHDLIRIIPDTAKIRPGYAVVALTHRTHGRPLLLRAAYGTSIPHLDPADVANFPVVRLDANTEDSIADLAEQASQARVDADSMEREIADDAERLIDDFIGQT